MYILITIFGVSLVGILSLVVLKTHALGNGGETFITRRFHAERDRDIEERFKKSVRKLYRHSKIVLAEILHIILELLVHGLSHLLEFLKVKTEHLRDAIRGRGVLKKNGSASFFLKDIVEHKRNHIKKGRIDD